MKSLFTILAGDVMVYCLISFIIGALCWPYLLHQGGVLLVHYGATINPPTIAWWQGGLLGLVPAIGQLGLPGAVVIWVIGLFL